MINDIVAKGTCFPMQPVPIETTGTNAVFLKSCVFDIIPFKNCTTRQINLAPLHNIGIGTYKE